MRRSLSGLVVGVACGFAYNAGAPLTAVFAVMLICLLCIAMMKERA